MRNSGLPWRACLLPRNSSGRQRDVSTADNVCRWGRVTPRQAAGDNIWPGMFGWGWATHSYGLSGSCEWVELHCRRRGSPSIMLETHVITLWTPDSGLICRTASFVVDDQHCPDQSTWKESFAWKLMKVECRAHSSFNVYHRTPSLDTLQTIYFRGKSLAATKAIRVHQGVL